MDILLRQLDMWYETALGSELLATEKAELKQLLPNFAGRFILQLGGPSEHELITPTTLQYLLRVSPEFASIYKGISIQSLLHELPILPESIALSLVPHIFEFHSKQKVKKILNELFHITAPGGYVCIIGFNPLSLFGIAKYFKDKKLPWRGRFYSSYQIKRWLFDIGFSIVSERANFFRPPFEKAEHLRKTLFMEVLGRIGWSNWGGVYFILAQKESVPLTLADSYTLAELSPAQNMCLGSSIRG